MKHEIGILKLTVQSPTTVKKESEDFKSAICIIKEEIKDIKTTNLKTESKINATEEESEDDDEIKIEKLYSCQCCNVQIREWKSLKLI